MAISSDMAEEAQPSDQAEQTAAVRRNLQDCLAMIDGLGHNLAGARLQLAIDALPSDEPERVMRARHAAH